MAPSNAITAIDEMFAAAPPATGSELDSILEMIQARHAYLPKDALRRVARTLRIPLADIRRHIASRQAFTLEPLGRHVIQVCEGMSCHDGGGRELLACVMAEAGIDPSGTSSDREFTLETVRCFGHCSRGPILRVNEDTYTHLEPELVGPVLSRYRGQPRTR